MNKSVKNRITITITTFDAFIDLFLVKQFDMVTFFDTFEHLPNPIETLQKLKLVLKNYGKIAISVPNRKRPFYHLYDDDIPPHHLMRFTTKALCRFLENNGFSIEFVKTATPDLGDIFFSITRKIFKRSVGKLQIEYNKNIKNKFKLKLHFMLMHLTPITTRCSVEKPSISTTCSRKRRS